MKQNFIIWIVISMTATAIYSILTLVFSSNDFMFNLGKLVVPIIATLGIPFLIGLVIVGISYFFTKKRSIVFSRTVWLAQTLCVIFLFISSIGQGKMISNESYKTELEPENIISNEYLEFKIPQDWKYQNMQLLEGQIYNILCFFNNGTLRISADLNINNLSHIEYYNLYKEILFNDMKTKMENFMIIQETPMKFLDAEAIKVTYESQYKGKSIYGETICFSKNHQMVVISMATVNNLLTDTFYKILDTLIFKK